MHDIRWIRENPKDFDAALKRRGIDAHSAVILKLDEDYRNCLTQIQELQQERNDVAKQMGQLKREGKDASDLVEKGAKIKESLPEIETESNNLKDKLKGFLATLPNILADDVPDGQEESDNQEIRTHLDPTQFSFDPKTHFEIGETMGLMDFETAAKVAGSRFVILKGALTRLERALAQFMLDTHTEKFGYTEISTPLLVNDNSMFGTTQLPKFSEDSFKTTDGYWLIPTAEVSVTNTAAGEIVPEDKLPLRYVCHSPCFRSEAGSAGRDTRGMLRQHQFYKVELVSMTLPEKSAEEHERMTGAAEEILKQLKIPFRTMKLCAGDTGFGAQRTYDLEAWLPGQDAYREISSCSVCGDFQARRMNARFRPHQPEKAKPQFIHTLNGSGLAVGRTLIAVMENYQTAEGGVVIPDVLRHYMNNAREITKDGKLQ
tara:strand:+ start:31236 stop:32528 length:1293 start_codon:yes stop_codon:yes gene_type:complete